MLRGRCPSIKGRLLAFPTQHCSCFHDVAYSNSLEGAASIMGYLHLHSQLVSHEYKGALARESERWATIAHNHIQFSLSLKRLLRDTPPR